jgi:hypothetical protein
MAAASVVTATPGMAASTKPHLKLGAKSLAVNKVTKLTGSHLAPKQLYTVMLAKPDLKHKQYVSLIGGALTDSSGNLKVKLQLSPKTPCGSATLYAFRTKDSTMVSLKVKVTGCGSKPTIPAPPPPAPAIPTPTKHP